MNGSGWVELSRWTPDVNAACMRVDPIQIGIWGLPLHLWSMGFFKAVGGLCFLEVEDDTRNWRSLEMAWIWTNGDQVEKIPRVLSLFDRGKEFRVYLVLDETVKNRQGCPAGGRPIGEGDGYFQIQKRNPVDDATRDRYHYGTSPCLGSDVACSSKIMGK